MTSGADKLRGMDTEAAQPKTYLKIRFNGGTIRSLPFDDGHMVALSMTSQMSDNARKMNVALRILHKLLGAATFERVAMELIDTDSMSATDVMDLLFVIAKATVEYKAAATPSDG